jgi:hypothetical protein
MSDTRKKAVKATSSTPTPPKAGWIPWPPVIYITGIAASLLLHALYPLPWFGSPMADILVAVGWLALLAMVALLSR